jgi:hypothetical protein
MMVHLPQPIDFEAVVYDDFHFDFIRRMEGGQLLKAYIPRVGKRSGATIATGIDLGQHDLASFKRIVPDEELIELCKPYLEKRGDEAFDFLLRNPLTIQRYQANRLDKYFVEEFGNKVARSYYNSQLPKRYKVETSFKRLPLEAKTAALSVAWHLGWNMPKNCPKFWGYFLMNDWVNAQRELYNFYTNPSAPKGFVARRRDEAKLLVPLTGGKVHTEKPTLYNPLVAAKDKDMSVRK